MPCFLLGAISPSFSAFPSPPKPGFRGSVAFKIYDVDKDNKISNGELFKVLKLMVGNNLKDSQLQQIVDKTIIYADKDGDGKVSFEEFCAVVGSSDVDEKMVLPDI